MNLARLSPQFCLSYLLFGALLAACSDGPSNTAQEVPGNSYYINCESMAASEGTMDAPWNDFEAVNSMTLEPGDRLFLRRGTTCTGIFFSGSSDKNRPRASQPWPEGGVGIVIRGNSLKRLQGDAIVALATSGAIIEDNVVSVGNLAGKDYLGPDRNCSAGIWAWNANNTLIQRNEVSGYRFGQTPTDGCDGTGFDIDNQQDGTVIQYNYSHNNEGGFILLCSDDEPHGAEVRYNLSVDDGKVINASPCKFPTIGTFDGIRFYNNTFVAEDPHTALELTRFTKLPNAGDFQFANNIIYATTAQTTLLGCGERCTNNLFYNLPPVGTEFVVGDPLFEDMLWRGTGRLDAGAAFRIRAGSPAFAAGLGVVDVSGTDYFGDEIPTTPSIGMHQPLN
jgi:hypothetical protein